MLFLLFLNSFYRMKILGDQSLIEARAYCGPTLAKFELHAQSSPSTFSLLFLTKLPVLRKWKSCQKRRSKTKLLFSGLGTQAVCSLCCICSDFIDFSNYLKMFVAWHSLCHWPNNNQPPQWNDWTYDVNIGRCSAMQPKPTTSRRKTRMSLYCQLWPEWNAFSDLCGREIPLL